MSTEYEVIEHPFIQNLNIFLVNLDYRTPHLHEEIELILVLDGWVTTRTLHEAYDLRPSSLFLINRGQLHEFKTSADSAFILCLQVSPQFCADYFPAISHLQFDTQEIDQHLPQNQQTYVKALLIETAYQYYAKAPGYQFLCVSLLNQLFWIFLNQVPYHILSSKEIEADQQRTERLRRILNFIDENYRQRIQLSDIAALENLSTSYLSHFIKDNLNQSFQEYLSNLRFTHARELVAENRMKLIDICEECGFSDYRYLYQAFMKHAGCTPHQYQQQHQVVFPSRRAHSPETSQQFYTIENTLSILENLHRYWQPLIGSFPQSYPFP